MRVRTCKQLKIRDYGSHSRLAVCAVPSAHQSTQLVGGDTEASPRGGEQEGGADSAGRAVHLVPVVVAADAHIIRH